MLYFRLLLCTSFFALTFCKESPKLSTIEQDKINIDLKKEIAALEADRKILNEKNAVVNAKITDKTSNQKFNDLLRKQKYANNRFLESIDQYSNYLKIKSLDREKFYLDIMGSQAEEAMIKQYDEYMINKRVNPPSYPWRKQNAVLPGDKNKKAPETKKEGEHGAPAPAEKSEHGGGHGSPAPAPEKPAEHGGGHH